MLKTEHYLSDQFFVITGGPGAGKTTLLDELGRNGFLTVDEDARRIIKEQLMINGEGLPWQNKEYYARLMFEASVHTYQKIKDKAAVGMVFFDRGLLDTICYMNMENIPVSKEKEEKIREIIYNKNVFILPPWKEIYENDTERKQDWDEAVFTFQEMKKTYLRYGYEVIEVPKGSVQDRCTFVLENINRLKN
ncbi:AAA family ATPase [Chryseobacterium kwangjuense]|uniref:ATPase n=1 Tax=Chryseobacterium kwangjuense TaxID=267125 RepID=A0A135W8C1_9FLAO|nr:AAA family ATPase [Chryseobacterium kwangjuense]KXH81136.1 ATPase [Chryseobacterium kwangjuense]